MFEDLSVFGELMVPCSETLELLNSLNDFDHGYKSVTDQIESDCRRVLELLAQGYNDYHWSDKAEHYRESRRAVSRIEANLLLLKDLGVFNSKDLDKILRGLEEGVDHLNSLVKNMEDNGVDRKGKSEKDEMDLAGVDVGELRKLKAISEVI